MVAAFLRALAGLGMPPLRRVIGVSLSLAVLSFVLLWLGLAYALHAGVSLGWAPLDWLVELLGAAAVIVLSWLLFPAVATLFMGFFLGRVAAVVEAVDYPNREPARPQPLGEVLRVTLRLMLLTIALNLLALPLYLLAPGLNVFVFLGLNGYLFGREYFEVVALRRLDTAATRLVRRRFGGRIFIGGVVIAGLFAVPLVNLVAPVVATAFMLHLFEALPRIDTPALAS
jgi:uncharacterized protein involved in cysteine biosynthesis